MAKYVDLKKKSVNIVLNTYQDNNRPAIIALEDGEYLCVCSVNIPNYPLKEDEIIIKDYSENEGVLQDLIDLNIVSEPIDHVTSGHIMAPICKLKNKSVWKK